MLTDLPEGIASVTNEDFGVGDTLTVRLKNGMVVIIDCLNLSGEHECQVGVYGDESLEVPIAGISFDPNREAEVYKYKATVDPRMVAYCDEMLGR